MQLPHILSLAVLISLAVSLGDRGAPGTNQPSREANNLGVRDTLSVVSGAKEIHARQFCPSGCFSWVPIIIGGQLPRNARDVTNDAVRLAAGVRFCDLPWNDWRTGDVRTGFRYRVWIDQAASNINIQAHTVLTNGLVQYRVGIQLPGAADPQWQGWRDIEEIQGYGTVCRSYLPGGVKYLLEVRYKP